MPDGTVLSTPVISNNRSFLFGGIMRKPSLYDYDTKMLIALSQQRSNSEFDQIVRKVLYDKYKTYPYSMVCFMYRESDGIQALALGDVLARYLIEENCLMDDDTLEKLLKNISTDDLWNLAVSDNVCAKERARELVLLRIDEMAKASKDNNVVPVRYIKKMMKKYNKKKRED